ncbi:MAG: hypothetical protein ACTHOJ_18175 [Sphingomonas oligoaromativorans]
MHDRSTPRPRSLVALWFYIAANLLVIAMSLGMCLYVASHADMTRVQLPNGWRPRDYQMPAWLYLEKGGRHAELLWHRRAGKDEICLHRAAVAAHERPATYWHMLPQAAQARKAIWEAINPHTGKRRIDEAFPKSLRTTTREQEMMIKFKCGSTWQVVGSDNFNSLVGSPPAGVTVSEWALANPAAAAYLRPILLENNGWQLYITTPRGKNHAWRSYQAGLSTPGVFAQRLSAEQTGALSREALETELVAYQKLYGTDAGRALFRQEYYCDENAAILGAIYGAEMRQAADEGRVCDIVIDPALPVHTAWDLGYTDDTAIWFYQVVRGEIRFVDFYSASGKDIPHFVQVLRDRAAGYGFRYGEHWLPHDAAARTLASGGKSVVEQLGALGVRCKLVPNLSVQDGIQAVRMVMPAAWFDRERCADGVEALEQYQREWDPEKRVFSNTPKHDWTSHPADAFRMAAVSMRPLQPKRKPKKGKFLNEMTLDELFAATSARTGHGRI